MRILLTNDDGIAAPGLATLLRVALTLGEVEVFAPDRERSACAHGMTMREPLRVMPVEGMGVPAYAVSGLPADCVNMGRELGFDGEGPDLVLSGINAGPNLGFDTTYSGTVAGAMEGAAYDIPSISLSLAAFVAGQPLPWDQCALWLGDNFPKLIEMARSLPRRTFLNVNVPPIQVPEIRGMRVARLAERVYEERIVFREDPWGRPYYWQGGAIPMDHDAPGTDVEAIRHGFVSLTPCGLDWTAHGELQRLSDALK